MSASLFRDSGPGRISVSAAAGDSSPDVSCGWKFSGRRLDIDLSAAGTDMKLHLKIRN